MPNATVKRVSAYFAFAVIIGAIGYSTWIRREPNVAERTPENIVDGKGSSEDDAAQLSNTKSKYSSSVNSSMAKKREVVVPTDTAPVIETPEVIATFDVEFVRSEVERMSKELEDRKAIERLNNDSVTESERIELGALLQREALFRHRLLEANVEALAQEVEDYEKGHVSRVATYSKGRKH
jgi:hypothetical protein